LIDTLAHWLKTLTGMPAVALSPAAGAAWRILRHDDDPRRVDRARRRAPAHPRAESAHGTNPATAALCGYAIDPIPPTSAAASI